MPMANGASFNFRPERLAVLCLTCSGLLLCSPSARSQQYPTATSVGVISYDGVSYPVYPQQPGSSLTAANPFLYENPISINYNESTFYDKSTFTIQFDINLESPPLSEVTRVINNIVSSGAYGSVQPSSVSLNPMPLHDYRVEIKVAGEEPEAVDDKSPTAKGPFSGTLRIAHKVKNPAIQHALESGPSAVTVLFYPYYLFKSVTRTNSVFFTKTNSSTTDAWESVFGKSASPSLVVNRAAVQKLQSAIKTSISVDFYGDPSSLPSELKKIVDSFTDKVLDEKNNITFSNITAITDNILIYGHGGASSEISPTTFNTLTKNWKTSDDVENSFESTWQTLHDLATHNATDDKFFDALRSIHKSSGSSSMDADVFSEYFTGDLSTDSDFSQESDYSHLTDKQRKAVSDYHSRLLNTGSQKTAMLNKAYKDWTGEDYKKGTTPKSFDLRSLKQTDLTSMLNLSVGTFLTGNVDSVQRTISKPLRNLRDSLAKVDVILYQPFEDLKDGDLNGQGLWAGDTAFLDTVTTQLGSRVFNGMRDNGKGDFATSMYPLTRNLSPYPVVEFECDAFAVDRPGQKSHNQSVGFYDDRTLKTAMAVWTVVSSPPGYGWQFDVRKLCGDNTSIILMPGAINTKTTLEVIFDRANNEVYGAYRLAGRRVLTPRFSYLPARFSAIGFVGIQADWRNVTATPSITGFEVDNLQLVGKKAP